MVPFREIGKVKRTEMHPKSKRARDPLVLEGGEALLAVVSKAQEINDHLQN